MTNFPIQGVVSEVSGGPLRDTLRPQNLSEPLGPVALIAVAPSSFSDSMGLLFMDLVLIGVYLV